MRVLRWHPTPRGGRVWITAWLAAVAIVLATVVPVLAAKTPLRLADAAVTPWSVTDGDTVTFRVTYRNLDAVAAASVKVEFDGQIYNLSPVKSKKNVVAGIRYEATVKPEAGSGPVRFVATDERGRSVSLTAGTLKVEALPPPVAPPSDPPPTDPPPTDPPPSAPPPNDPGGTGQGGTGGSGSSGGGGSGSSGSGASPSDGGVSDGASSAGGAGTEPDTDRPSEVPMSGLPPTVPDEPVTAAIDPRALDPGASWTGRSGRADSRGSETAAAFGAAGIVAFRPAPDPLAAVLPVLVTTLGGATMVMAFMVFGKRRRDGEPTDSDMALATAAATGSGAVASAALVDAPQGSPARPATPVDAEMAMPRWRRPSLLEARKADPLRTATAPVVSLSFDHGMVDPVAGHERRRIRYRVVRLLDGPDELTALDVGVLDAGDEVQLLERSGVYWFVLCPDGQRGWVHKMVLGDVVEEPEDVPGPGARATGPRQAGEDALAARLAAVDAPTALGALGGSEPVGYDAVMTPAAWALRGPSPTDAGLDVDDDVMRAFLASQGRG